MATPKDMEIGTIHSTNKCGDIQIIDYLNTYKVKIIFLTTGYKTTVAAGSIRLGKIKDPYYPSLAGVGYLGEGPYPSHSKSTNNNTKCYHIWASMLKRCYNPKDRSYPKYGGKGVRVHPDWYCYQTFAKWADKAGYFDDCQLDKDIEGDGMLYSPVGCCFVSPQENSEKALAKHYTFRNPLGELVEVYNLSKFCKKNNLQPSCMSRVHSGNLIDHKGWRINVSRSIQ